MRWPLVIFAALAALALPAAGAAAQSGSEFDQYVPQIPDGGGDKPLQDELGDGDGGGEGGSDDGGGAEAAPPVEPPPAETAPPPPETGEPATEDPEHETVQRIAESSAPKDFVAGKKMRLAASEGESPGSSILDLLAGPAGGIGAWFPLLLIAMVVMAVVYTVRRRDA